MSSLSPIELYLSAENSVKLNDYSSYCTFSLNSAIVCPPNYAFYLRVLDFTCPYSWYICSEAYNQLILNGVEYRIPPGNYSATQLCTQLTRLGTGTGFSFNELNLKVPAASQTPFSIAGSVLPLLGIEPQSGSAIYQSNFTADCTGNNSIYILSNLVSQQPNRDLRSVNSGNLLCRVPVGNVRPGGMVHYEDRNGCAGLLLETETITTFAIVLEDEDRRELQSSLDWDMTLQLSFVPIIRERMDVQIPTSLLVPFKSQG
jgi:hypothetical protein